MQNEKVKDRKLKTGGVKMTPKQNFLETVRWGNPEYLCTDLDGLNLMLDPLTGSYDENMKDEWGCQWGYGNK